MLVAQLCRLHSREGHQMAVYCLKDRGPLAQDLAKDGLEVALLGPSSRWKLTRNLYSEFRHNVPDVVHCHNANATISAALPARLAGARSIVSTRHGCYPPPQPWRRDRVFWLAARSCDRVVAVCQTARFNLGHGFGAIPEKLVTLYNGVAPASRGTSCTEIRKEGFTIVHVARLAWYKDQGNLLRAVAEVKQQVPDLFLWVIGDGAEATALKELAAQLGIERSVRFLGTRSDVGQWLAASDLFVLNSLQEGVPLSLLEAMAAGLPAIVTDVGGMPEIARASGAATVVPVAQPHLLADAIVRVAGRRVELKTQGTRARECYERNFTLDRMGAEYLKLYAECAQTSRSGQLRQATDAVSDEVSLHRRETIAAPAQDHYEHVQ
jgi:glycosyltransferase involved in cell wall biosynthesis